MNIEILTIEIELFSANLTDQANAQAKIDNLIKEIKESGDNNIIEVNLIAIYYTYLVFLESSNNTFKFLGIIFILKKKLIICYRNCRFIFRISNDKLRESRFYMCNFSEDNLHLI